MDFCPKCGAMLLPKNNKLECKCGYTKDLTKSETERYEISEKVEAKENIIMKGEEVNTLPTTTVTCPKCGYDKASWWLQQTRSADEAETRFLRGLK